MSYSAAPERPPACLPICPPALLSRVGRLADWEARKKNYRQLAVEQAQQKLKQQGRGSFIPRFSFKRCLTGCCWSPTTDVWWLFPKLFTANIIFGIYLWYVRVRPENQFFQCQDSADSLDEHTPKFISPICLLIEKRLHRASVVRAADNDPSRIWGNDVTQKIKPLGVPWLSYFQAPDHLGFLWTRKYVLQNKKLYQNHQLVAHCDKFEAYSTLFTFLSKYVDVT